MCTFLSTISLEKAILWAGVHVLSGSSRLKLKTDGFITNAQLFTAFSQGVVVWTLMDFSCVDYLWIIVMNSSAF